MVGDDDEFGAQSAASAGAVPAHVNKADYGRILQMDLNHAKAQAVREETQQRARELREQRERFRLRGQMLREQRLAGRTTVQTTIDDCRAVAQSIGDRSRAKSEHLRQQRKEAEGRWQEHGRGLQQLDAALRQKIVTDKTADEAQRAKEAAALSTALKKLNEEMDDTIFAQNLERANRVKAETSERVIRASKQVFVNDRWNKADELRDSLSKLRARRKAQELAYVTQAMMIKAAAKEKHDAVSKQRQMEMQAQALVLREEEKRMEAEVAAYREAEDKRKRALHESMEADKMVPDATIPQSDEPSDTPMAMFVRFFGFRKRGSGQQLSSVAL